MVCFCHPESDLKDTPVKYRFMVIWVDSKQKIKLLHQVRHIVECNGSEDVLKRVDYDLDSLFYRKKWNSK